MPTAKTGKRIIKILSLSRGAIVFLELNHVG